MSMIGDSPKSVALFDTYTKGQSEDHFRGTSDNTPDKNVRRDENGTAEFGEPSLPAHPALSGNTNSVLTAQTVAAQINELTEPNNAGVKNALNATGEAPIYACRAWVNFNGEGTVAIRASGNVSSITDNGTGDYTVNFATDMPDADYSATNNNLIVDVGAVFGLGSYRFLTRDFAGNASDRNPVCVSIFR